MTVFPQHDHTGLGREAVVPIGWVRPKPEAYLGQVVSAICGSPADAASAAPARPAPVLRGAVVASADPASAPIPATATQPEPAASGVLVQIAATPDEAEAHRILTAAAARMEAATPGLTFHVDPAMVAGRQLYRAVISGFHDRSAAKGWCMALRQAGGACFLR
jgi:D-alanyl-D-alanine carboxypeptidase